LGAFLKSQIGNDNLYFMHTDIKLPTIWDEVEIAPVLRLKDRSARRQRLWEIIVESLRAVAPQRPTGRNLQKLAKIRRKKFLPLLGALLERGMVVRHGSGSKGDPYRYGLPAENR
jgi:hypothetical protein